MNKTANPLNRQSALAAGLLAFTLLLGGGSAPAATITFSAPGTCSAASDVSLGGTGLAAYTFGTAGTLNGVAFTAASATGGAVGTYLNFSGFGSVNASAFYSSTAPFSALPAVYTNLLKGSIYGPPSSASASTTGTVTLTNLIIGRQYAVQVWSSDPRASEPRTNNVSDGGSGNTVSLAFKSVNAAGGVGHYTIGTFTADATIQPFNMVAPVTAASVKHVPQVNLIQLRDGTGYWSGTTDGNWANGDTTSANFSGMNYGTVKAAGTNVFFADKSITGTAVLRSNITITASGVTGCNVTFQNQAIPYLLTTADTNGIYGAYSLTVQGTTNVTLNGTNNYSGNTTISSGTLILGANGALPNTPVVSVASGATLDVTGGGVSLGAGQTLSGSGAVKGNLSINAHGRVIPGGAGAAGTLTFANSATFANCTNIFDLSSATNSGNDQIVIAGGLTVTGNNLVSLNYLSGSLSAGAYTLITTGSGITGGGTFALDRTTYPYRNVTLVNNGTTLTLVVGAGGSSFNLTWKGDGTANAWDVAATANWLYSSNSTIFYPSDSVIFDNTGSNAPAINLTTILTPASVTVNSTNNYTFSGTGKVSGSASLTKSGTGTLYLATANDYTGATTISGGTLALSGGNNRLPAGTVNFSSAGILSLAGVSQTLGNLTLADGITATNAGAGGTLNLGAQNFQLGSSAANNAQTLDLSGLETMVYSGPALTFAVGGRLTGVSGISTGTLTLAKTNTITAATFGVALAGRNVSAASSENAGNLYMGQANTINANTLTIGNSQAYGNVYFLSGLASPTLKIRAADGVSRARLNLGAFDNSNYTPAIGTLNLVNGVSGVAVLDAYIGTALLGESGFGSGGNIGSVGTLVMGGGLLDATNIILGQRLGSDASGGSETGVLNINGGTVLVGALTMGDQQNFTGTVSAIVNMFNGATLQAQTIQPGAGTATRTINWNGGTIQNYPGTNLTASGATFNLGISGTPTAQLDIGTTNTFDSSTIVAGSGSLTMTGLGMLVLAGANTATGPVYVNNGTLSLSGSLANRLVSVSTNAVFDVSPLGGGYTLSSGQTVGGAGVVNGSVNMSTGSFITPGSAGAAGTLTLNNDLTLNGGTLTLGLGANISSPNSQLYVAGTLNNAGAPTYISLTFLSGFTAPGTYTLVSSPNAFNNTGSFALDKDYRNVTLNVGTTNITITVGTGGVPGTLTWQGDGSGNVWDLATTINWSNSGSPDTFYSGDYVLFNDSGSNTPAINLTAPLLPNSIIVNASQNYTFSGGGSIAGSTSLVKSGTGDLTLATANTYSGGTVVSNGTLIVTADPAFVSGATVQGGALQIGDGVSSSGSVTGDIVNNSQLTLNRPDAPTVANNISGTGSVVQSGAGAVTLSGANAYTGPTTINNGIVLAGSTTALGAAGGAGATVNSGGTLDINGVNLTGSAKVILNGGWLVNNGAAQGSALSNLTVNANSYIGGVYEFDVRAVSAPSATVSVASTATLTKTNGNFVYLEVDGTLANNGLIDVGQGTLAMARGATTGSGSFTVEPGAALYLYGVMTNTLPVTLNGGVMGSYSAASSVQQGNITLTAPSTISNAVSWTVAGNINNNGNMLTLGGGSSGPSYKGQISGTGGLTINGSSTVYLLSTNNSYSGGTYFNSGTLCVGDGNSYNGSLPGNVSSGSGLLLQLNPPTNMTCVITGAISGGATLYKQYAGTTVLTATNSTFAGGLIIQNNGGVVQVTSPGAMGTGSITVNSSGTGSGTLQLAMTGVNTITNTFTTFKSENTFGGGGLPQIENVSGTNTILSDLKVPSTGGNGILLQSDAGLLILSGIISSTNTSRQVDLGGIGNGYISGSVTNGTNAAAFGLTKDGIGTWTLAGINGYTSGTTVNAGTLLVNGSTANSPVTVGPNATFGGSGMVGGTVTLQAGGIIQGGDANYANTLTVPTLNLGNTSNVVTYSSFKIAAGGTIAAMTLNVNGTNIVNLLDGSFVVGTNTLITYTGSIGGTNGFAGLQLGTLPSGVTANLLNTGSAVKLAVTSVGVPPVVNVTPAGTNVFAMSPVLFTANVTAGTAPFTYQWYDNHTNVIAGGTNATLTLTNLATTQSGNYTVAVTNGVGGTSALGTLTVNALVAPTVGGSLTLGGGGFQLTFSGPAGETYKVIASTNLTTPRASWSVLATGLFGAGPVTFTDSTATNQSQQFYLITAP